MEKILHRAGAAKKRTKPAHRKPTLPTPVPKLSPETERIVRLARRLKGAFGPTECNFSSMPMC